MFIKKLEKKRILFIVFIFFIVCSFVLTKITNDKIIKTNHSIVLLNNNIKNLNILKENNNLIKKLNNINNVLKKEITILRTDKKNNNIKLKKIKFYILKISKKYKISIININKINQSNLTINIKGNGKYIDILNFFYNINIENNLIYLKYLKLTYNFKIKKIKFDAKIERKISK
jgi:hypothetical protein